MTKGSRHLSVFVGFQIKSDFHSTEEIEKLVSSLSNSLGEHHGIVLNAVFGLFPPGRILWSELRDSIHNCDVAIFDISENNPNVMIEVGLAYGSGKQVILLKNRESYKLFPTPSDLAAIHVSYEKGQLDAVAVSAQVVRGILSHIEQPAAADYYFRSLWGFNDRDSVLVVCSELDEPEKRQFPEPNEYLYLSKYGDVDSLVEILVTLHRLYPRIDLKFHSANEVRLTREEYTGNVVLIGGPDYNRIVSLFEEHSLLQYMRGDREEDIFLKWRESEEVFVPTIGTVTGSRSTMDYGFVLKRRNPHNLSKRLVLIGGCHTYGVFGAASAFSYWGGRRDDVAYGNCKLVVDRFGSDPDFCAVFEVRSVESSVVTPCVSPSLLRSVG